MASSFNVDSSIRLSRQLKELGAHVEKAAMQAMDTCANLVAEDAKSRCPVLTGKLRDSIEIKKYKYERVIYANAENQYGFHYGYVVENSPKYGQPFMYPALYAKRAEIIGILSNAIRDAAFKGDS